MSARETSSLECAPLVDRCTLHLYRGNAFRILGSPVDSSLKDITRQVDRLQKMAEFSGPEGLRQTHACALSPAPLLSDIREAAQHLKDPEQRLIDEFFWFWPAAASAQDDPAMQAVQRGDMDSALACWHSLESDGRADFIASHNIAVLHHLRALDATVARLQQKAPDEQEAATA
ncbi:MAG: hypothetical protein JWO94_1422, partial [Verrucomicrobiaceae bacterium]|nr:hypothetical protein [Verrucomicrobiaceae bacterium]